MDEMIVADKRPRGRPRGTGKDDRATLDAVADLIVVSPKLRPSTAMKRVVAGIGDSHLRRLQDKWQQEGAARLLAAQERAQQNAADSERQVRAACQPHRGVPYHSGESNAGDIAWLSGLVETPVMRAMREWTESPAVKLCTEMQDINSKVQAALGLVDHAAIRSVLEQHNVLMRNACPSNTLAVASEVQRLQDIAQPKWLRNHWDLMERLNPLGRYRR